MRMIEGLDDAVETAAYPATSEEFIEEHGDVKIELPNGDEQLGDVLRRLGEETYEAPEDVRLAAYSAVSSNAIGRKGYSDRDPVCPGEDGHDQLSF